MTVSELIAELERVRDKTRLVVVKKAGGHLIKAVPIEDTIEPLHTAHSGETYHCIVLTAGTWP